MISFKDTLYWILSIIILAGCSQSRNDYGYITLNPRGTDTRDTLSYSIDMRDSTTTFEIFLCARLSSDFIYDPLELKVLAISPSGKVFSEEISLPTDFQTLKKNGANVSYKSGVYDVEWGYRSGITPIEYGEWKLDFLFLNMGIKDKHIIKGIYSFGAYCKKEDEQQK